MKDRGAMLCIPMGLQGTKKSVVFAVQKKVDFFVSRFSGQSQLYYSITVQAL